MIANVCSASWPRRLSSPHWLKSSWTEGRLARHGSSVRPGSAAGPPDGGVVYHVRFDSGALRTLTLTDRCLQTILDAGFSIEEAGQVLVR